ncbi:DUF6328 family protein [Rhodococcus sp. TAF43]|uniref:DUF6328 family protein n=1 Tax=unclassified Rhodococcus (in: high G+C Gram-positive bacteria) TaxID=192944 RepID=UPI0015843D37|nr:DUF6328 family protein [Rhodococcus sp. W8901]QKT10977.1 hypothetical protein HUN07_09855 [Rhodococcus sp. W8901]
MAELPPAEPGETPSARLARNFSELLQELRVAQAGVQILFAFLLAIVFTDVYAEQSAYVRGLHLVTMLCAAASSALLIAPAVWHRILFRHRRREEILRYANRCALAGSAFLAATMTGTVLIVAEVAVGGWFAKLIGVATAVVFVGLWFVVPRLLRPDDELPA